MGKKSLKRKAEAINYESDSSSEEEDKSHLPPLKRMSTDVKKPAGRWSNKQRVLVLCSRGLTARERHLVKDLARMMPHAKPEPKFNTRSKLPLINEIAESRNCNKVLYFEERKHQDVFMWLSDVTGCSVKFQVMSLSTSLELNLSGNCLAASRPLLKFSKDFNEKTKPHLKLIKELLVQTFGIPFAHPKSQPFFDHVFVFTLVDDKIWFRNYQILHKDTGEVAEIGPRFVLNPIRILSKSFSGETWYENPKYRKPRDVRMEQTEAAQDRNLSKDRKKVSKKEREDKRPYKHGALLQDTFNPLAR